MFASAVDRVGRADDGEVSASGVAGAGVQRVGHVGRVGRPGEWPLDPPHGVPSDFPAEHYERTWDGRFGVGDLNAVGRRGLGL